MSAQPELSIVAARSPLLGIRVMVVDDDEAARDVLRSVLEAEGAETTVAGSAAEALTGLSAGVPDVMLVDIGMPVADGFLLVRQLRLRPAACGGRVPVAAVTGYMSSEDRATAHRSGFQAYLVKPVDQRDLITTVKWLARTPANG
jgi:two-component system CheB/CheR fusion protein